MKRVSRRSFVAGMGAMPFALWLQKERIPIIPSRGGALNVKAKPVIGRIELVVQSTPS